MSLNQLFRGVDRDTAPEGISNERARDARNFRLVTIGGQGMIMTSVRGNEQSFELSDGFLPIGHAVFQGISIIFSVNPNTGEGEIGSFPSPALGGGFQRVYLPLQNFTGTVDPRIDPNATRLPFRTTCLNLTCADQIDAQARISYDGSIDVFWTDFKNPMRHVSTGFHSTTGADTGRLYWHGNNGSDEPVCSSLINAINVFFESCGRPQADTVTILDGGELEAGNWFFYPRYVRQELSPTSFLSSVGPVQLTVDDLSDGPVLQGDPEGTNTNKKVIIVLNNIDSTFQFVQIGFSHHHGTTYDTGIINRLFPIPPGATSITIEITGTEGIIDATAAEIIADKTSDDTVKSLAQTENILWGANWKSSNQLVPELRPIAAQVVASAPDPLQLLTIADWYTNETGIPFQYKDYNNTLRNIGYFRGEPYAFAIVFVIAGGKSLPPIAVQGTDHWVGSPNPTNDKGVVRFPSGQDAGYTISPTTNTVRIMGVRFDTSGIVIPPEILSQICGFYFVRAERKPQLIYQGLASNVWRVLEEPAAIYENAGTLGPYVPGPFDIRSNRYIAEFRGQNTIAYMDVPFRMTNSGTDYAGSYNLNVADIVEMSSDRAAIFSADHFFLKTFTNGQHHIRVQGTARLKPLVLSSSYNPSTLWEQDLFTNGGANFDAVDIVNVAGNTASPTPTGGFVSRFEEGNTENTGGNLWFRVWDSPTAWEVGNREVRQRNYLGVQKASADTDLGQAGWDSAKLVNVYRFDPIGTVIADLYDPGVELYYRIGEFRPIASWGGVFIEYHGDCFLQRTYFKQASDSGLHPANSPRTEPVSILPIGAEFAGWGNMVGFISENVVNTAMRYSQGNQEYFPAAGADRLDALTQMAQRNDYLESDFLNRGYDRSLDIKAVIGDDPLIPFGTGFHPTRVRYSSSYVNDSTTRDGYLIWGLDNYKDFDHSPGEIMSLMTLGGNLYSIHRHAMRRHFITERYLNNAENGAHFILGDGDTLSDRSDVISGEMGTQHKWSVIKTDNAIYGIDFSLRTAWRFGYDGFSPLSEVRLFHSDIYDAVEGRAGQFSDSSVQSGDAPVCNEGIVGWYDRKHREIGWSFLWALGEEARMSYTAVYDEKANSYVGKRYGVSNAHSPYYMTINEDMHSFNPAAAPWSPGTAASSFWLHDHATADHSNFWGIQEESMISAIVNPMSTRPKIFDNCVLAGTDIAMEQVDYRTEFQSSTLNPFIGNTQFWLEPRYKENAWHFTVPKTVTVIPGPNQEYGVGSPLRGKWMEAQFFWDSPLLINVRSLETFLRESLQ
jgi:hypothetical protein